MASMKKVLFGLGVSAGLAMAVFGVNSGPAATAQPGPVDPNQPTLFTYPSTYVVNPDGTQHGCVQSYYGLSC